MTLSVACFAGIVAMIVAITSWQKPVDNSCILTVEDKKDPSRKTTKYCLLATKL